MKNETARPDIGLPENMRPMPVQMILEQSARRAPQQPFLDFLGRVYTYGDINAQADRVAAGLQAMGLAKGDRVGLFLPNCPQYVVFYYGILRAGGTVVNFSPLYSTHELIHQVEDSQTDFMVCLDLAALYDTINAVLEASRLKALIVCSFADALPVAARWAFRVAKRQLVAKVKPCARRIPAQRLLRHTGPYEQRPVDLTEDIAMLQYTGGTTGVPKGAMLSHANVSMATQQAVGAQGGIAFGAERMLGALPFFHIFANVSVLNGMTLCGGLIAILPKFELKAALALIKRHRITFMPGVPTMFQALLNADAESLSVMKSVRVSISGGAPMAVELKRKFEATSGGIILEGYGLTESTGIASVNPLHGANKAGSVGVPVPGTEVVIVDKEDPARILPHGETGEICLRGPQVMRGYWRRPEATAAVLGHGYLQTGDVGYLDPEGYLFIVDRLKDMINVGGFKVFPRMIEEALYEHGSVLEASVIGVADEYLGQRPKAFVVLNADARGHVTADDLKAYLKTRIGKHEQPASIELRDSLPKTMIGKLSKKELVAEENAATAHKESMA